MHTSWILGATLWVGANVWAQAPVTPDPAGLDAPQKFDAPALMAGWKSGSRVVPIGLDSAFRLAMDRSKKRLPAMDPATFVAKVGPLSADDYRELLQALRASKSDDKAAPFSDPIPFMLEAARRRELLRFGLSLQARDDKILALAEAYVRGGASSGLSAAKVDDLKLAMQRNKQKVLTRQNAYQDALDDLKTVLSLPSSVPIVPDDSLLRGFEIVFVELEIWERSDRDLKLLDGIAAKLPKISDIMIDTKSLLKMADEPNTGAEAAIAFAIGRIEAPALAQSLRRRLRRFITIARAYQLESTTLVLCERKYSAELDLTFAPPAGGDAIREVENSRKNPFVTTEGYKQKIACWERLIALWIEAQTLRLGLMRDLDRLPATWDDFVGTPSVSTKQTPK